MKLGEFTSRYCCALDEVRHDRKCCAQLTLDAIAREGACAPPGRKSRGGMREEKGVRYAETGRLKMNGWQVSCLSMSWLQRGWFALMSIATRIPVRVMALCLAVVCAMTASAPAQDYKQTESARIRKVIDEQQAAWNRGDLEGFMAAYWNSEDLTFFSGARESKGSQSALDRYKKNYQGAGHEMGKLEFANVRIEMLAPNAAFVRGEFHLTMTDGTTPHGLFTLIFRRFPEGWKIVHDHSSGE
jgi:ketosteroid isomerase-like protein